MPNIPQSDGGSSFPEGVLDFLGKFAWGCQVSGGAKFPVTPAPQNVQELKSFLGLLNYYGKFIPNLNSLLQHNHKWKWSKDCDQAF